MSIRRALQILFMIAASVSLAAARDLALISNKTNVFNGLTLADLVKVCKAQTNRWPDGKPITLIMRAPSTPEMKTFVEKVYAMPEVEINNLIVSANHGRANHPAIQVVASDEELLERVASTPGAIGVVDVYAINSSVSVIKLAGKLPLEPGYLLHGN